MCGVIVVDAESFWSTWHRRDAYIHDHCLYIIMIIWSSINCPTVICLPTVCYFSREKPQVKSTAPGSILSHICLWDLFLFSFIFKSIIPKTQRYFAAYFISHLFEIYLSNLSQFYPVNLTISYFVTRKRDWQPLINVGLQVFVLCVQVPFTSCCVVLLLVR